MAEQGAFNRCEIDTEIRHISQPNTPISPFIDERIFASNVWLQLIRELPHINGLQCYPSDNIPLNATLNYMNALSFENAIVGIENTRDNDKICVLFDDDTIKIYDTKVALNLLGSFNIRKFNGKKWAPGNLFNYKKSSIGGVEYDIHNIIDEKVDTPANDTEEIRPKEALLENLYLMGFPLNLAKKALIAVKNTSLDAAIENILVLQDEELKNSFKNPTKENVTMLKAQWQCPYCTLINETIPDQEPRCEACDGLPGMSAYYTKSEIKAIQEEEKLLMEEQNNIELDLTKKKEQDLRVESETIREI